MRLPLRVVVTVGVVLGLVIPMSAATIYTSSQQKERLLADANRVHAHATDVLALGVSKALWDLAPEGAAPLVKSILDDDRVVSATVVDAQGAIFHEEKDESRRVGQILSLERKVVSSDQDIGKVTVEFSLKKAEEAIEQRLRETLVVSGIQALLCIAIVILLMNRRVLRRVERLKGQAGELAAKRLDQPFTWERTDEIGELGASLETTRAALRDLFANLESIVAERTATIKMILDHVRSGFLLVDKNLKVQGGYTKSCELLLETKALTNQSLTALLRRDADASAHFQACVDQVFDDFMPEEVTLDQIPKRFTIGERTLCVEGSLVRDRSGAIEWILFTVIDVTLLEQTEKENRANRSMVRILQNFSSFKDFIGESRERLETARTSLRSGDEPVVRRELHTLKGNASAFGLDDLAHLVHKVEDEVAVAETHLEAIRRGFSDFLVERRELLKMQFEEARSEEPVAVEPAALEVLRSVVGASGSAAASQAVEAWLSDVRRVPAEGLLGPLGSYVQMLAQQRGKEIDFVVEGGSLAVDTTIFKPIVQNLVHLVRNAVDHGIETPDERGDKPARGRMTIRFTRDGEDVTIAILDDGRGIDEDRVRAKAVAKGLLDEDKARTMSRADALLLIFADGVSTAETLTDTSGRGVGMSAVRDAVKAAGGNVTVETRAGHGTAITLRVPTVRMTTARRAA